MNRFIHNLRNILVYSDSDLLEITIAILILFNPLTQDMYFIHPIWHLMGIISSIILFIGLGKKSLKLRQGALLWAMANLTAINITEIRHGCFEINYLFQNVVVAFLWWKVSKQKLIYQLREGSRGKY